MTDEHKQDWEQEEQPAPKPVQPPANTPSNGDDEETQTVSLFELMAEETGEGVAGAPPEVKADAAEADAAEAGAAEAGAAEAGAAQTDAGEQAERTAEEKPTAPDDDATMTGPVVPVEAPRVKPTTSPPLADNRTLVPPPLEQDKDATQVQPRLAFPGSTDPQVGKRTEVPRDEELPTRPFRRPPQQAAPPPSRQARERTSNRMGQTARYHEPGLPTRRPDPVRVAIPQREAQPRARARAQARRRGGGCVTRILLIGLLVLLLGTVMSVAAAVITYGTIASQLPPVTELRQRASDFETSIIYDSQGTRLYSFTDPEMGNREQVELHEISPLVISATIATEDVRFYQNPGFDPIGIGRAVIQAAQEGEVVSGASTITQQLARALLLDEEERAQRTFSRKIKEIILAAEMNRTYEKNEILELYLNEIYYGNLAYGIEAAAEEYFNKSAKDLNLAEASLLAGLPQAPAAWDPYTAPELALVRQAQVLSLMADAGYVTKSEAQEAINASAAVVRNMEPPERTIRHPHFVFTVLQQLEEQLGAQAIYGGGLRVHTTLDPEAQRLAEETIAAHRNTITSAGASNAALVAIEPQSGAIKALVGSLDFENETIQGQVNMALAPRSTGSTIKPLVYLSAMEEGWTPSTLIWDVPTQFPNGANPPYEPKNYDDEFHGPMRLRPALGNSYNIPAVKALEFVGVCPFIEDLRRFGIVLADSGCASGANPSQHGHSLALGGGEISPLAMTSAFATLANGGLYNEPYAIDHIENSDGEQIFTYTPPTPEGQQVVSRAHAFLLSHILSDNEARQAEFGPNNQLVIDGHDVAAKTGTSGTNRFDVLDGWTIGYTPQIATGVWVGNTDRTPVHEGQSGYLMATPIWHDFLRAYLAERPAVNFAVPDSVVQVEVCATSGTRPGPACAERVNEYFTADTPPLEADEDFIQRVPIDLWTGRVANEHCEEGTYEATFVNLLVSGRGEDVLSRETENARKWIEETEKGRAWAEAHDVNLPLRLPPEQSCDADTPRPEVSITEPELGDEVTGEVDIRGVAQAPEFKGYILDFGLSDDPQGWAPVEERREQPVESGLLGRWDTSSISFQGPVTIRLTVFGPDNPYTEEEDPVTAEARVRLTLYRPTPTPTPTETPSPTETPTPTPTLATPTPEATDEPITVTPIVITFPAPTIDPIE